MKQLVVLTLVVFCSSFGHGFVSRREEIEDLGKIVELGAEIDGKYREWKRELPKDADDSFQQFYQEMHDKEQQQERENLYSSALDQLNSMGGEDATLEEIKNVVREIEEHLTTTNKVDDVDRTKRVSCSCLLSGQGCSCCQRVRVALLGLNQDICGTLRRANGGLYLIVKMGSNELFNKQVLANLPPVCVGVPYIKRFASICLQVTDVKLTRPFHACVNFVAYLLYVRVANIQLWCYSHDKRVVEDSPYDDPALAEAARPNIDTGDQRLEDEYQFLNATDRSMKDRVQRIQDSDSLQDQQKKHP